MTGAIRALSSPAVRRAHLLLLLLLLGLPGLMLLPTWPLGGLGASEDDLLYYYPSRVYFHDSIAAGRLPEINPWTGLGRPVLADPQQAVWYPTTWLFAILPPSVAYPAGLYAHYALALLGMYRLLRACELSRAASVFGGIAFAFCGFMFAHRAHYAIQHAAAWTPWVFWRISRYADAGGGRRLLFAALPAALQCLTGHVQIAALTALGTLAYVLAHSSAPSITSREAGTTLRRARRWLTAWLATGALFAVQLLPTVLYLRECTRTERTFRDFVENSWNPASALMWITPMIFGQRTPNLFDQPYWGPSHQCEQLAYAGLLPLLLAAAALRSGWRAPGRRGWAILLALALLLSLGEFGPICPILYWVPGSSLFRVPARGMLLFQLAVAALAAGAMDDLMGQVNPLRARLRLTLQCWTRDAALNGLLLTLAPLTVLAICTPLLSGVQRQSALNSVWPLSAAVVLPVLLSVAAFVLLGRLARRPARAATAVGESPGKSWAPALLCVGLLVVDLGIVGWTVDTPRRALLEMGTYRLSDYLASEERDTWLSALHRDQRRNPPTAEALASAWDPDAVDARLWVVSRRHNGTPGEYVQSLDKAPANLNILFHTPTLTDYGPLQPREIARRFAFKPWGESDIAPALLAETAWMAEAGVAWVLVCEADLPAPVGGKLIAQTAGGMRLFRMTQRIAPASAWPPASADSIAYEEQTPERFATTLRRAQAAENSPATERIVVSRAAISGWTAALDGRTLHVGAEGWRLAADLPAGAAGRIEWTYRTPGLFSGAIVNAVTLILLVLRALR